MLEIKCSTSNLESNPPRAAKIGKSQPQLGSVFHNITKVSAMIPCPINYISVPPSISTIEMKRDRVSTTLPSRKTEQNMGKVKVWQIFWLGRQFSQYYTHLIGHNHYDGGKHIFSCRIAKALLLILVSVSLLNVAYNWLSHSHQIGDYLTAILFAEAACVSY